jgi:hypothetical protein
VALLTFATSQYRYEHHGCKGSREGGRDFIFKHLCLDCAHIHLVSTFTQCSADDRMHHVMIECSHTEEGADASDNHCLVQGTNILFWAGRRECIYIYMHADVGAHIQVMAEVSGGEEQDAPCYDRVFTHRGGWQTPTTTITLCRALTYCFGQGEGNVYVCMRMWVHTYRY